MNKQLPAWKALLLAVAVGMIVGGVRMQGCALPKWPTIGGGASHFIVVRESTKDDDAFGKLKVELQDSSSAASKAIADAGWKFWILDDDDGAPILSTLGVAGSINDARRELLCISPPDKLVYRETLPPNATAASVLSVMQAKGKR